MPLSTLDAFKIDEWDRMIDVNIRGVPHGIAGERLPIMKRQGFGHFVNLSSIGGHAVMPTRGGLLRHEVCGARDLRRPAPGEY